MYDNHSTDGSQRLAEGLGMEVRTFGRRGELNDQHYLEVKNHCWKEERGKSNYVIVCDADEFLLIPNNYNLMYGSKELKASSPTMKGYNMISDRLPYKNIMEIKTGSEDVNYAKQIIFDPNRIEEINFVHGCHRNHKKGEITTEDSLALLHYRMIGGIERILKRHHEYRDRMSKFNLKHNMGHHYLHEDDQKRTEWDYLKSKAVELW